MSNSTSPLKKEKELRKQIEKEYELTFENEDSIELPPDDIVAFNELRSCADILRMVTTKQLIIAPDFQREFVWKEEAQTRFIDSLIKQLPIPSMCISFDFKTNERLVVDGLQRISTIIKFLKEDSDWRLSNIEDVDPRIKEKTVQEIKQNYPELYHRVENLSLPITVIRFDSSKPKHMDYLFTIFHRLNTGGTQLSNQEVRNGIYQGELNNLLKHCVNYDNWKKITPFIKKNNQLENEEFILRFFAFFDNYKNYHGQLSKFLNYYMKYNKDIDENSKNKKYILFTRTIDLIYQYFPDKKSLFNINKVTMEGLLIGVAKNLDCLAKVSQEDFQERFRQLCESAPYSIQNLSGGLLQKSKVESRLDTAIKIFGANQGLD
jgi:hypothetical protein